jgi:hypothetical protein
MKDLFCLWSKPQKGVPIYLEAVLKEEFDAKNPMEPKDYDWASVRGKKYVNYPNKLWLICKEKLLLFDYYPFLNGFIVSNLFLSSIESFIEAQDIQKVSLSVVSNKGEKVTDKEYYFIRFVEKTPLVDYKKSKFILEKDANIDYVEKMGFGIKKYEKLEINNFDKQVFIPNDAAFSKYIFCTEQVKEDIISKRLYGFDFIYYFELPMVYNERYSW